jgi:hypothetical protein
MLRHLHERIAATLASARSATLASSGPAGLQAHIVPCVACGMELYLLVPHTSDQLLNLEYGGAVVVMTAEWHVEGRAQIASASECPAALLGLPEAPWSIAVTVHPVRVSIAQPEGWGAAETIDVD